MALGIESFLCVCLVYHTQSTYCSRKPLSVTRPPFFTQTGPSVSPLLILPYLHIQFFFFLLFAASLHLASRGDFSIPMHAVPLSAGRCPFAPVPTWQGEEGTKGVLLLSASLSLFCLSVYCCSFHSQRGKDQKPIQFTPLNPLACCHKSFHELSLYCLLNL